MLLIASYNNVLTSRKLMTNQFIICLSKVAQDNQRNTSEECYLWEINVEINLRSLRNDIYWHCVTTTWRKMVWLIYFSIFYLFISHLGNYCGVFVCFFFHKTSLFRTKFRADKFSRIFALSPFVWIKLCEN